MPKKASLLARPVPSGELGAYCVVDPDKELRQGEILSNLTYYINKRNDNDQSQVDVATGSLSYAVIVTPDCDLLQDFKDRNHGKETRLFAILMFGVEESSLAKDRMKYAQKEWKHVQQNEMDRFHFISSIKSDDDLLMVGMQDLVVDFKRYFTLPPREVYQQFQQPEPYRAYRRCRLSDLWREDLQRRAMSYMQRVGLPDPSDEA